MYLCLQSMPAAVKCQKAAIPLLMRKYTLYEITLVSEKQNKTTPKKHSFTSPQKPFKNSVIRLTIQRCRKPKFNTFLIVGI